MIVELTEKDVEKARECADRRNKHNQAHIRDQRVAADRTSFEVDLNGALAELAVVKMTGYSWYFFEERFWEKRKKDRDPDVGPIEVKTNNKRFKTHLLLYQRDGIDQRPYLLAIPIGDNRFEMIGWRFGFECRKKRYWMADWPRPCFAVPDKDLYSVESLEKWCISHNHEPWTHRHDQGAPSRRSSRTI